MIKKVQSLLHIMPTIVFLLLVCRGLWQIFLMVEDTITDLDKLSANVLYTMMMMDLKSPRSELAVAREMSVHSNDYDDIRKYYMNHLWDMKAVRQAVVHGLITQEEYTDILKEYEAKYTVDTEHDIPSVDVG